MTRHALHGMVWESEIDLHLPVDRSAGPCDLRLVLGPPAEVGDEHPPGRVLARHADPGRPWFTVVAAPDGRVVLRFHRLCDMEVSEGLDEARLCLAPGQDQGYLQVLAVGMLASVVSMLRGHPVLHAAAVQEPDGSALALVGRSGSGKSTLSALLCRDGAGLVTDDVLRVDLAGDGPPLCRNGAAESRLRDKPGHVLEEGTGSARRTADGRSALAAPRLAPDLVPLDALVLPRPSRSVTVPAARRLPEREALLAVLSRPRVVGWEDPRSLAEQFRLIATLVRRVPVVELTVPWHSVFPPGLATDLRAVLRPHLAHPIG